MYGLTTKQRAVMKYLLRTGKDSAINIKRNLGFKHGNIYQLLKNLETKGVVTKVPDTKQYVLAKKGTTPADEAPVQTESAPKNIVKPKMKPFVPGNPLIPVYQREIQFVEDGIDSLMITKNYLQRRVEQLKQEDARHA